MELYPLPENKNLVWVIEDSQQIEEKIELQPGKFFSNFTYLVFFPVHSKEYSEVPDKRVTFSFYYLLGFFPY